MIKQQGFSLLEILIAFAILGISLGILLRIFSSGANMAAVSEDYTVAVQLAESVMARAGNELPLQAGEQSGWEDNNKYHWLLEMVPFNANATAELDPAKLPVQMYKVRVTVEWDDGGFYGREFELTTFRLAGKV